MSRINLVVDRIEQKCMPIACTAFIAAVLAAASILSGAGVSQAQPGGANVILVPRSSDYISEDRGDLVGLTKDRWGRVTLTLDWSGEESRSLQMGRIVDGEWVNYTIEVGYEVGGYPHLNQAKAYLIANSDQLVTMMTTEATSEDVVEVREFPNLFNFSGYPYRTLMSAPVSAIPLG
jgi:hypothetical protein